MGSSAPPAPTYNASQVSADQTKSNVNTAVANKYLNSTNQITPYGNLTYAQTGTQDVGGQNVPQFTATQTLSPEQQAIYDKTTGLQTSALDLGQQQVGAVTDALKTPFDVSKAYALPTDQTAFRDQAYGDLMSRFNTDYGNTQSQLDTKLRNQGLQPGTKAYDDQMMQLARTKTDAGQQAYIQAGNLAGQNLSQAQTLHNSNLSDQQLQQSQPVQMLSTLMGQGGQVTQPTYAPQNNATIANTDISGNALARYQGQMANYNQNLQSQNSMMGGLFGLGGSAAQGAGMYGMSKLLPIIA